MTNNRKAISPWAEQMAHFIKVGQENNKPVVLSIMHINTINNSNEFIDIYACPCGKQYRSMRSCERHFNLKHSGGTRSGYPPATAFNKFYNQFFKHVK